MKCNSDKCHCPDCMEARKELRLTAVEKRVDTLELRESNRDMMRAFDMRNRYRGKFGEPVLIDTVALPTTNKHSRKISEGKYGPIYKGWTCDPDITWRWRQSSARQDLWRRMNLHTRETFGQPWSNRGRPVTPWGTPLVMKRDKIVVEHDETNKVGTISQTKTDRVIVDNNPANRSWIEDKFGEPTWTKKSGWEKLGDYMTATPDYEGVVTGRWRGPIKFSEEVREARLADVMTQMRNSKPFFETPAIKAAFPNLKEPPMFTSDEIMAMMTLYNRHNDATQPLSSSRVSSNRVSTFNVLFDKGLALRDCVRGELSYTISPKGLVFVEALRNTPLPVQAEPEWTMPPRS